MLRGLLTTACRWLQQWSQDLARENGPAPALFGPVVPRVYRKLQRVVLTAEVSRTLFRDFAEHRRGPRGAEEVGWVLLGLREEERVVVLATLPAGAHREAGVAHVRFNSTAQGLASRIVRQADRRLGMVGVVHTHPGSLRHPSDGDFQGDCRWVGQLRGGEGVFAIGTADDRSDNGAPSNGNSHNGKADSGTRVERLEHMHAEGRLCFSWYALGAGDARYRRLPVDVDEGPDLARALHPLWPTIEQYAEILDGLCRQLAQVTFEVVDTRMLAARIPVAGTGADLRVLLQTDEVQYYLDHGGVLTAINPSEPDLARAVFLVLAELARQRRHPEEVATLSNPA